jgi:calcineurin-like phosphoesterase
MALFSKIAVGVLAASTLAFSAANVSAAIVCSGNECWHTHEAYEFPRETGVVVHPDNWRWGEHEHFAWHEHEGRGYWHGGEWRAF